MSGSELSILEQARRVYAECETYRDTGVVTTSFYTPQRCVERKWFSTRFARGRGFLFEYRWRRGEEDWDQCAVWLDGTTARVWWSLGTKHRPPTDLRGALGAVAGVSSGVSARIPFALMPELLAIWPPPLGRTVATRVDDAEADAAGCIAFDKADPLQPSRMWFDRTTLLIRREAVPRRVISGPTAEQIEQLKSRSPERAAELEKHLKGMSHRVSEVETVTTYEPELNGAIAVEELRFVSPG